MTAEPGRQRTRGPFVDATGAGGVWRDSSARHRPPQLLPSVTDLAELAT